jgi:hypothetical protein
MLSQSARIGAPVVGFAVGLLMTCGLADAARAAAVDTKEGVNYVSPPNPSWVVQLIGDSSEAVAASRFRELQNKHKLLLEMYKPVVLNTAITPRSEPIWTRIRVELSSREAAESLCSKLEAAGARCVVQRSDAGTGDANHALRQPASGAAPASALNGSLSPYQASPQQPGQAPAAGVTAGGASDHNHHPRRNSTCHSPRWRHNRRHYRRCHNNKRYSKCRGGSRGVIFGSRVQPSALGAGQRPRRRWGHMGRT